MNRKEIKELETFIEKTGLDVMNLIRILDKGGLPCIYRNGEVHDNINNAKPIAGRFWQSLLGTNAVDTTKPTKIEESEPTKPLNIFENNAVAEDDLRISFAERYADYSQGCKVGDIAYPGGSIVPEVMDGIKATGIVAWKNPDLAAPIAQRGLVLGLNRKRVAWSDTRELTGIKDLDDGWGNTQRLIKIGKEKDWTFHAAEWCANYAKDGVKPGEAFLPAKEQWEKIALNTEVIAKSLEELGSNIKLRGYLTTSSEESINYVWYVDINDQDTVAFFKTSVNYVMCLMAI